jgi:hypothetical protein
MGHLGDGGYCIYCLYSPIHTLAHHPRLLSLCLGLSDPRSPSPNIWHPPYFKPENNPDNATSKRRPASCLRSQPTTNSSYSLYNQSHKTTDSHQQLRHPIASDQHIHCYGKDQPKGRSHHMQPIIPESTSTTDRQQ